MASQGPKKKGKGPSLYSPTRDKTLTKSQAKFGAFRDDVVDKAAKRKPVAKGSFRVASNPTTGGFSTGYHEAFVVTDAVDKIGARTPGKSGMSKMPKASSGIWSELSGKPVAEKNLRAVLEAGDGARTDTARTILTAPKGKVAGHTGSGVRTTNQSDAHDLLRKQNVRVMGDVSLTPRSIGVIAAATTVFSMAPGKFASTAENASKLKSQTSRKTWEEDRNTSKRHLSEAFGQLNAKEKKGVRKHMDALVADAGDKRRRRVPKEPSSPLREPHGAKGASISGGDYFSTSKAKAASKVKPSMTLAPKAGPREVTMYVSQPFRLQRQTK